MSLFLRSIISILCNALGYNSSEKFEEVRKHLLFLRLGVALFVIVCILCTALFFSEPELKEWSTELAVEAVLTMEDLGYQDDRNPDATVYAVTYGTEKAGDCYRLALSAEDGRKSLNIDVYRLLKNIEEEEIFKHLVEKQYTSFQKKTFGAREYMPAVRYERAIEQMVKLDASLWDAEEAYAIQSINLTEKNLVFVKRRQEILILKISGFPLNNETIEKLLDKIQQISIQEEF